MKSFKGIAKARLLLIVLATISFVFGACFVAYHPLLTIQIHNQTSQTLKIFIDGEVLLGDAAPGGEVIWRIEGIHPIYKITAQDMAGNVVFSTRFTRDDLKGKKTYQVIIPPMEKETGQSDNTTEK